MCVSVEAGEFEGEFNPSFLPDVGRLVAAFLLEEAHPKTKQRVSNSIMLETNGLIGDLLIYQFI